MPNIIVSNNCATAWRDACQHIIDEGDGFNLMVNITEPKNYISAQLLEITTSGLITQVEIEDVANTIFPAKSYLRNALPAEGFYELHESLYYRGRTMHRRNRSRWGNYFLRFTRFGTSRVNQLQSIIDAINARDNEYAGCYIMHVSSAEVDSNTRNIGGPCLQYVQFAQVDGTLNLIAVYRNHDFLRKALGNYIGLSDLLWFVCEETGHTLGSVTVHSIHYYLESKMRVNSCLSDLSW